MNLTIKLTGSQAWAWSMSKMITLDQRMMSISLSYLIAITSKQADINQWVFAASKISWESGTLEKHLNNCIIHLPTYLPTFQMTYLCFRAASMGSSFLLSPFPPFSSSFPLSLLMLRAAASSALAFKSYLHYLQCNFSNVFGSWRMKPCLKEALPAECAGRPV